MNHVARVLLLVADAVIVVGSFLLGYWLRFRVGIGVVTPESAPLEGYLELCAFAVVIFAVVFWARGLYETGLSASLAVQLVERTLGATLLALLVTLAATFFYRERSFSRSALPFAGVAASLLLPLPRLLVLGWTRRERSKGRGLAPAVIVGTSERARELRVRLEDPERYGLQVVGLVAPVRPPSPDAPPHEGVLGTTADLDVIVRAQGIREVLIAEELPKHELLQLIATCEALDREPRFVPCLYDLCIKSEDFLDLDGLPFVAIRERRFEWASLALKRAFDVLASAVLLVLSSPILIACVVAIRRGSPGGAFFTQARVGEGGRVFRMWKLRSMVQDAERRLSEVVDVDKLKEPVFKVDRDPRITPTGAFLRRWSLDELPQLWNVFKGDMSLVGPRPEEEKMVARYDAHQRRRLKAKPGLTGLQQVEARGVTSLEERIRLDVLYIRRRTFLFDLWILARTGRAVLSGKGAR